MNQIKTEIHLFRHGETTWNVEDGFKDLKFQNLPKEVFYRHKTGEKLKDIEFNKIYSSPSLRTKQTANAIWPDKADKIIYLDDLVEIKLGNLEGKLYSDIKKNDFTSYDHFFNKPHLFSLEGAESFLDLTNRSFKIIKNLSEKNLEDRIAIVSHGAFIKAFMSYVDQKEIHEIWDPPFMDNCSHNIVIFNSNKLFSITRYADIDK